MRRHRIIEPEPLLKPYDIRDRTFEFADRVLDIVDALPLTSTALRDQLSRAGMSIGSNVEEADGAVSRADKRRSLVIARKECRETRYLLRLIARRWKNQIATPADINEVTEILYILSSIIDKLG